ncbi:MAG TPA: 50S ribosomal protein L2 [Bdellovibrionota bacterium]|nr:50S ribosomal protein L2 [Bdellovibrionota bacterium]
MPIVGLKPFTPSSRFITRLTFDELTRSKPLKALTQSSKRTGGRNNQGRITSRWIGGGHKRRYRKIDFLRRDKEGIPGKVVSIEYDPNRSTFIAQITYADGDRRYILAPEGLKVGYAVVAGEAAEIRPGNALPLSKIPTGTLVHNVEMKVGRGGQMVRTAGSSAQLMARDAGYAQLRLPSGEIRKVPELCYATVGQLSNIDHENITIGKAGRTRWFGRNPSVRGTAMNPIDHPHGGGEGKTKGGRHPVSPWGLPTKGYKTRLNKRTEKFIVQRRKK